ncbi:MAG TPA: radical SAM protein [Limnochordia bacterium]|nr:radical SAM protein [Limnochordia bacterium]
MSVKQSLQAAALREALRYVRRNPEQNFTRLISLIRPFARIPWHREIIGQAEAMWADPQNNWRKFTERALRQLAPNVAEKIVMNFFLNAALIGVPIARAVEEEHGCNVPWAILMDPTSNCNLRCEGCWAGEYAKGAHLSLDELDSIIQQGKELGVFFYLYSGGEPLLRSADILTLARKHSDAVFCAFTNATLVTPELAEQLAEVGNVALAISVEGFADANDFRRGAGTYAKTVRAMDLLREVGAPFGFSTCYHAQNTEEVASEEFVDAMVEKGCLFGWYFTYMPIGQNARPELLVSPEQRKLMYERVHEFRGKKPIFLIDFWNDGEYCNGCIAGGRHYLHINAHGDVEPCAFIHYADSNIREKSLLEALKSPLFMQYRQHQPFNENPLRPCPALDNPDALVEMVAKANAYSTQRLDHEPAEVFAGRCREAAAKWGPVADAIWQERTAQEVKQAM